MPRRTTTPTAPKTKAPTTRADRAAAAAARAAVTRAPRSERQPAIDATLSRADEARIVAESRALERGDSLHPEAKLDRDLAHLADPNAGRRTVSSRRRREPQEIAMVYRGSRHRGPLVAQEIDVQVPTEENADKVADMQSVILGMDEPSQRAAWAGAAAARGVAPEPYVALADRLVLDGIDYHFSINKTTLVHEDDAEALLSHPFHLIELVDGDPDEQGAVPPSIARRNAAAAASYRRGA